MLKRYSIEKLYLKSLFSHERSVDSTSRRPTLTTNFGMISFSTRDVKQSYGSAFCNQEADAVGIFLFVKNMLSYIRSPTCVTITTIGDQVNFRLLVKTCLLQCGMLEMPFRMALIKPSSPQNHGVIQSSPHNLDAVR
jgi:hypothetical protein